MNPAVDRPDVSVVMPVYNAAGFVARGVASVLAQQDVTLELVVVDDGSDDDTLAAVHRAAAGDPRVRTVALPHSGMPGVVRNAGAREARADLVAFLDADDLYLPGRLASHVMVLQQWPEVGAVFADHVRTADRDAVAGTSHLAGMGFVRLARHVLEAREPGLSRSTAALYGFMCLWGIPMCTDVVTLRRGVFLDLGGFAETMRCNEDEDLWFRLVLRETVAFLDRPQACIWRRPGSLTADFRDPAALRRSRLFYQVNVELHERNWARGAERLTADQRRAYRQVIAARWCDLAYHHAQTDGSRVEEFLALAHAWHWHPSPGMIARTLKALVPRRLRAWRRARLG